MTLVIMCEVKNMVFLRGVATIRLSSFFIRLSINDQPIPQTHEFIIPNLCIHDSQRYHSGDQEIDVASPGSFEWIYGCILCVYFGNASFKNKVSEICV